MRRGRSGVLIIALVVVAVVGWALYERPAHAYSVSAYGATWTADVRTAISEHVRPGPIVPSGKLRDLPGVGRIVSVVVDQPTTGNREVVMFLTGVSLNEAGLAYIRGYAPPSDTCNVHLGGPWWQLVPLNVQSMSCPRGFEFTGGG